MDHSNDKLTPLREKAIRALLEHQTVTQAAAEMGISRRTLGRWLQDPAFRRHYLTARRERVLSGIARLQRRILDAVDVLYEVAGDKKASPAARIHAAETIIDRAVKGLEIEDFDQRLEALEAEMHKNKPKRQNQQLRH